MRRRRRSRRSRVPVLLDGPPVPLVERPPRREQAGRHELQDRPQLAQVVLDRRAGDREAERRTDAAGRLVHLRRRVLHELRLVEHESAPLDRAERGGLEAEHRIRGDDEVGGCRGIRDAPAALRLGGGHGGDAQARRESRRLAHPVRGHGGRRDDEERAAGLGSRGSRRRVGRGIRTSVASSLLLDGVRDQRERLRGLAEAHVVGEHAAEAVGPQERQPPEARELVGPQRQRDARGLAAAPRRAPPRARRRCGATRPPARRRRRGPRSRPRGSSASGGCAGRSPIRRACRPPR